MKIYRIIFYSLLVIGALGCNTGADKLNVQVYETSASGNNLVQLENFSNETNENRIQVVLQPKQTKQTITGFGGSFTEASAYLLNKLSKKNRDSIIEAYFGESGAKYSLTRTHMNSSDFSLSNYSYAPVEDDKELKSFSIQEDLDDIIPMIKDAMNVSKDGFKILSSPWTASPWMKDNKNYVGGKLLPEYYDTWALFFSKYVAAYKNEGIDIWGFTVENEPLGNGNNWESMHYTPDEMTNFVQHHLGPKLRQDYPDVKILGYDQNREHLNEWVDSQYKNEETSSYFDGTAIHWYASTYHFYPEELQYAHKKAPNKYLIQSEACVDSEIPKWKDDAWYWKKEATDWGWDWAPEKDKPMHPKYAPVNRYARDIIGCLNNYVDGWIDWNMVLNKQGGPNWFKNWCVAPVIVDENSDEIYFTPLYYVMSHFSRFIRPEAKIFDVNHSDKDLMITAAENIDGSIAVVVFNEKEIAKKINLTLNDKSVTIDIKGQALQTIVISKP
ncbi:glycoside hydrolase family 30 protein [Polaribacter dokdonensis]|uniref:Glucosylceramidase n=1 Tax=Polaribacter dokdonensis DSW-5 TaxID=1300348 RepID=A0A0N0UNS3_9FLAO|nr:glycoside hydrolase family 30 protein [Polaribacter dokdonensis]KOY52294.1 O-glycosyl hydrolase family 30 [Polaribacter dokdonensis DSW-5]SEE42791.1 glucosylceramidase [Polaribacter dokdonensis DSW-5]